MKIIKQALGAMIIASQIRAVGVQEYSMKGISKNNNNTVNGMGTLPVSTTKRQKRKDSLKL